MSLKFLNYLQHNTALKVKGLSTHLSALILVILGMCNTLAFAPFSYWPITLITLSIYIYLLKDKTPKQSLLLGFSYGLGWFGAGVSWVHVSIDTHGGMPLIASLGLMLLLVAYLSVFPAITAWATSKLASYGHLWIWLFPTTWMFTEWLRSWVFTGFPWLSLGYSQLTGPLSSYAPIIGEMGINWFLVFIASMLAMTALKLISRNQTIIYLAAITAITLVTNQLTWTEKTDQSANVLLVQGNIKQELRWAPEQHWPTMLKYLDLTRPHYATSDLIIWPEAAIPQIEPLAQDYLENLNKALLFNETALVTGILDVNLKTHNAFNNLIVAGRKHKGDSRESYFYQHANRYSKHHLLPIGEFVPFEDTLREIAPLFDLPMSSFTRGEYIQHSLVANGYNLTPALCYEIAFANQMLDNFNTDTHFIVTVSNDAWFGGSHGPHQHMEIAQMRALELGRPLLRATNNGVTGIVDEHGMIQSQLPQFSDGALSNTVTIVKGDTPYSYLHNKPLIFICFITFIVVLLNKLRSRKQSESTSNS